MLSLFHRHRAIVNLKAEIAGKVGFPVPDAAEVDDNEARFSTVEGKLEAGFRLRPAKEAIPMGFDLMKATERGVGE